MAGIEKLVATKRAEDRTLYCFLAGTLRREPEYAPLGYDRVQLYLRVRREDDPCAEVAADVLADVTLNEDDHDDDHVRIIDFSVSAEGAGCGTFALEVLCLIADWYGCRGIMGELFGSDLVRDAEKSSPFSRNAGSTSSARRTTGCIPGASRRPRTANACPRASNFRSTTSSCSAARLGHRRGLLPLFFKQ